MINDDYKNEMEEIEPYQEEDNEIILRVPHVEHPEEPTLLDIEADIKRDTMAIPEETKIKFDELFVKTMLLPSPVRELIRISDICIKSTNREMNIPMIILNILYRNIIPNYGDKELCEEKYLICVKALQTEYTNNKYRNYFAFWIKYILVIGNL